MRLGRIQNNFTAEGFDLVKNAQLDFVEICCNNAAEAQRLVEAESDVKKQIERTGIDVSCVGRWNHDILCEGRLDEEKLDGYYALLDTAAALGAKTFVCGCNLDPSLSLYRNYTLAIDFFSRLIDRAQGTGVKVAVQNCSWNNFIVSPEQWKVVLGELKELWLKFDASHSYNRTKDHSYLEELNHWGDRVAHVHVKGTTHAGKPAVDDPPAGMDDIRWRPLFSLLYAKGYDGDLSIEPHSATWHGPLGNAGIAFTRDFIRGFLLKA